MNRKKAEWLLRKARHWGVSFSRTRHAKIVGAASLALLLVCVFFLSQYHTVYQVTMDGHNLGLAASKAVVDEAVKQAMAQEGAARGTEIQMTNQLSTTPVRLYRPQTMAPGKLAEAIRENMQARIKAAAININGQKVTVVGSRTLAESVINRIKNDYIATGKNIVVEKSELAEKVEITEEFVLPESITSAEDAYLLLKQGTKEMKTHKVTNGESLWTIAPKYGLTVDDLIAANPTINPDRLQLGQVINLVVAKPYLTVITTERQTNKEAIKFATKVEYDKKMSSWESKVKQKGIPGEKEIVVRIVRQNGQEIERQVLSQKVLKEPTAQVVVRGTNTTVAARGTGRFVWPLPVAGQLTSVFGYRGREFHPAIDLATKTGTPVQAADSGTVVKAGWDGGYGYLVIVDHGNGVTTRYAHLSKIAVRPGQKVDKGNVIGYSGNSGRSTGPHLHFEIRQNGMPVNPLNFFRR